MDKVILGRQRRGVGGRPQANSPGPDPWCAYGSGEHLRPEGTSGFIPLEAWQESQKVASWESGSSQKEESQRGQWGGKNLSLVAWGN